MWNPPPWLIDGQYLQPKNGGPRGLQVFVGLDFGSAYTKVAIRPNLSEQPLIVDWDPLRKGAGCFLPGELTIGRSSELLPGDIVGGVCKRNLKIPLLAGGQAGDEEKAHAIAFLAWVLRYARAWLFHFHPALFQGRSIQWTLNIGCPSAVFADAKHKEYADLALRAWTVSQFGGKLTLDYVRAAVGGPLPELNTTGLFALDAVPEFLAEIAGYVFSKQRRNGLHLLVDIGAGTVDVACFNVYLHPEHGFKFPIFSAEVQSLGTHFLMLARYKAAFRQPSLTGFGTNQALPSAEALARQLRLNVNTLRQADSRIAQDVAGLIERVATRAKARRNYPNAPEWRAGVPTFWVGGGAEVDAYQGAFKVAGESLKLQKLAYPVMGHVEALSNARLLVAAGLTNDREKLGSIMPPKEIPPHVFLGQAGGQRREREDRDSSR